jgi:signal transduction histidine kinase
LSRQLIEMQGGTITVHSEGSGTGAEFCVRLPLR